MAKRAAGKPAGKKKAAKKVSARAARTVPQVNKIAEKERETPRRKRDVSAYATILLSEAVNDFNEQYTHPGNAEVPLDEFHDRITELSTVWRENGGLVASKRTADFDWDKLVEDLKNFRWDLLAAVWNHFADKAARMVRTGNLTQEEIDELWEEAHPSAKGSNPSHRRLIWGYINLCRKLGAAGCHDPGEVKRRGGGGAGGGGGGTGGGGR